MARNIHRSSHMTRLLFPLFFVFWSGNLLGQLDSRTAPDWHLKGVRGIVGADVEAAWQALQGRASSPVVVAVIDDGVDVHHDDLREAIWTNGGEVPDNGVDDDGNGYIDDVHGWNFIVDSVGKELLDARYEAVWVVHLADSLDESGTALPGWLDDATLQRARNQVAELEAGQMQLSWLGIWVGALREGYRDVSGKELSTLEELIALKGALTLSKPEWRIIKEMVKQGWTLAELEEEIQVGEDMWLRQLNPHYDARLRNEPETGYGNGQVVTSESDHGTHVSGIIAGAKGNGIGVDGIAGGCARIMAIRAVPDGDELDKDVANAIRYAVDNGAKVINMSFGKCTSPERQRVEAAMLYAAEHDVLMVHAAGNESQNADEVPSFPHPGEDERIRSCFIQVGATTSLKGKRLVADFSNYGLHSVDLFAPGDEIYSLVVGNGMEWMGGTSMAAPVVSGIAALLRAHFPQLSAAEVKEILMTSGHRPNVRCRVPGSGSLKAPFHTLSISGGVVNAHAAVMEASRRHP